jgi:uncharacterized protein DUF4169
LGLTRGVRAHGQYSQTYYITLGCLMANVVNLRTVRKRAQRVSDERAAQANRLSHGQSKHLRKLDDARQAKASRDLEGHRQENEEETKKKKKESDHEIAGR